MDQQIRIINGTYGRMLWIGLRNSQQWCKSFTVEFETGGKITIENQRISTEEQLPEVKVEGASDPVLILGKNRAIKSVWFFTRNKLLVLLDLVSAWNPLIMKPLNSHDSR